MYRVACFLCVATLFFNASGKPYAQDANRSGSPGSLIIPMSTIVPMAMTRPVWASTAKPGDTLYAITNSAVTVGNQVVIPSGTYVQGTIKGLVRPTAKVQQAVLAVQFDKLIFANGYTITLSGTADTKGTSTLATITVHVTPSNDLLLDNGTQIAMTLQTALPLSATEIAQAVPLSHAPSSREFSPATLCRFIPGDSGSPATPDIVIPGTPGTPDTVIPGIDGSPATIIPGIPPTLPRTIPGSPGIPASDPVYCPDPPKVLSSVPGIVAPSLPSPKN
jgi:hypothetical protein